MLVFVVVLLGVLGAAALIVARASPAWSVAVDNDTNEVVVKRGDEIRTHTSLPASDLPPVKKNEIQGPGRRMKDKAEADAYVLDLVAAAKNAKGPLQGQVTIETTPDTSYRGGTPSTAGTEPTTTRTTLPNGP